MSVAMFLDQTVSRIRELTLDSVNISTSIVRYRPLLEMSTFENWRRSRCWSWRAVDAIHTQGRHESQCLLGRRPSFLVAIWAPFQRLCINKTKSPPKHRIAK